MTQIFNLWTLVLLALFCTHCKTVEHSPDSYQGKVLTWGSGGGVTGQVTCTALLDNGLYFSGQGLAQVTYQKKGQLPKEVTTQLFENFSTLNLQSVSINKPGNTYRFVEHRIAGNNHRIVWSSGDDLPNSNAQTMYNVLKSRIEKESE